MCNATLVENTLVENNVYLYIQYIYILWVFLGPGSNDTQIDEKLAEDTGRSVLFFSKLLNEEGEENAADKDNNNGTSDTNVCLLSFLPSFLPSFPYN